MFKFLESTFGNYHDITTKQKSDDILEILVPVPGLCKDDLQLSYDDSIELWTVTSTKNDLYRKFSLQFYTTHEFKFDKDKIKAKVENGLLTITLEKHKEKEIKKNFIEIS